MKAFCAEKATKALEECMAALGGLGYMEETAIGRCILILFRLAQVNPR